MSISKAMRIAAIFFLGIVFYSFTISQEEKETYKSQCFTGKIEITKSHSTLSSGDGKLSVKLPKNVSESYLVWVMQGEMKEGNIIDNLKPGYYNLLIIDSNDCHTVIDNIEIKAIQ